MATTTYSWKNFPTPGGITTGGFTTASTNLCNSDGTNKTTTCGAGRFFNTRNYKWESEIIDIPSQFRASNTFSTGFTFSVKFSGVDVSAGAKWSAFLELVEVTGTGPVTYGTVYPLSATTGPAQLINRPQPVDPDTDENPTCEVFNYSPGSPDPDNGLIPAGKYVLRIRFVTTNTSTSNNVCFDIDNIGLVISTNLSGEYEGDTNGLSKPTWSTTTGSASVDSSGRLISDVSLVKSTQSAVTCNDNGSPNGVLSHCAVPSVKAIYHSIGYPKNQSGYDVVPFIAAIDEATIPYQSGTYTWTKTNVVHEDANNTYKHFFSVPEWSSADNYTFVNKTLEATTPSKPASTLTLSYGAGTWNAVLSSPITGNVVISGLAAYGSNLSNCGSPDQTDSTGSSNITITPGNTFESLLTGGIVDTPYFQMQNQANVNSTNVTNGGTVNIAGHTVTVQIENLSCSEYEQGA